MFAALRNEQRAHEQRRQFVAIDVNERVVRLEVLLGLQLAEVADVIRIDGVIVWHVLVLAELDNDRQADAGRWIFVCAAEKMGGKW